MGIMMRALLALALCAGALAVNMNAEVSETDGMALMESLGLGGAQQSMDKSVWQARKAQEAEKAEDAEIARLMAKLGGLDKEKKAAEAEATKKDIEAKKAAAAKAAIDAKAKKVEAVALAAQKDAETAISDTKKLRGKSAALMAKAKAASAEYQGALASGMSKGVAELALKAKKAMAEAQAIAAQAGASSDAAKAALANAAKIKAKADKAIAMEKENKKQLVSEGIQWAACPIFGKMQRLCNQDYPMFRKEYRKIRMSPAFKHYRWDIKQACKKAHNDDLEKYSAADKADEKKAKADAKRNPHAPAPDSQTHWSLPASKKVKKWCTTKFGAVPCSMLKKAQKAGLLGSAKDHQDFLQDLEEVEELH